MELSIDSVQKYFGRKLLLSDIYLNCKKGEILGIYGRNGSRKSTLFKIIAGIEKADNKFVKIGDKVLKSNLDSIRRINFLAQSTFLPRHLKVKSILQLFGSAVDLDDPLISELLNFKVSHLSSGQRRIVELYSILYSQCDFVLLDEPFSGLSPLMVEEFKNRIKEESKNKGILITDHNYLEVYEISDRHFILNNGQLREFENLEEIQNGIYI